VFILLNKNLDDGDDDYDDSDDDDISDWMTAVNSKFILGKLKGDGVTGEDPLEVILTGLKYVRQIDKILI
jgi:hypothetical protein